MICRKCSAALTGETAIIGDPMCSAKGYPSDYVLLVTCPRCQGTYGIRMWQSEASAVEDAEEGERRVANT